MKSLILALLLSPLAASAACMNFIAQSEIQNAINLVPGAGGKVCGGNDPCVCFDGIIWPAAVYSGGVLSNDQSKLDAYLQTHPVPPKMVLQMKAAKYRAPKKASKGGA